MAKQPPHNLTDLNDRSVEIFRSIVESFLETGEPVGSRNISRHLPMTLSPASVRNVMSDLEEAGLIVQPHTSAGRLPTEIGLRMFVDGLLQVGDLTKEERQSIEKQISNDVQNKPVEDMLTEAGELLSGLSQCAGIVLTDKQIKSLKQIEFVRLEAGKALVVLVGEDNNIENRIIEIPHDLPQSALVEASNYLSTRLQGRTLDEAKLYIQEELRTQAAELDQLTTKLIQSGVALWSGEDNGKKSLIVRGRSKLIEDINAADELERVRKLFDDLETKNELVNLLSASDEASGVRIFIGSENKLFSLSGSSIVAAPFKDSDRNIVGVMGIIGPTRLNYARIIPMVDYTAKLMSRLISS
jgi:heat-inducible transcriptional repressor